MAKIAEDEIFTYFNATIEGLLVGKKDSFYNTLTADDGFYIRYYPNKYNTEEKNSQNFKTVGVFNNKGLSVSQIELKDTLNNINIEGDSIVLKGTRSGGWAWVKKTSTSNLSRRIK